MTLSQSGDSDPVTIAQGSAFSAGQCNFVTTSDVTIPGAKIKGGSISAGSATVGIKATVIGEQCNLEAQKYTSSIGDISARGGQLSGGSKKTLKVVSQADINNAKAKLNAEGIDSIKSELKSKFDNNYTILEDSFSAKDGESSSSVAVNQEAPNGKATLKMTSIYSITAFENNSIKTAIDSLANFTKFNGSSIEITANVKIGPTINTDELKEKIKGKKSGEVRSLISSTEGVQNVDVKFSFFWVNSVPKDSKKIKIEFTVNK